MFITAVPITKLFVWGELEGPGDPSHRIMILRVCVYHCSTYYKAVRGRGVVEDMCYERRRAEALVDKSAHHALANAGGRDIV